MSNDKKKIKCRSCNKNIERELYLLNYQVCPYCNDHAYISCRERVQIITDENSFIEQDIDLNSTDLLRFYDLKSYPQRLKEARLKTSLNGAIITGEAKVDGHKAAIGVMDFGFMGGSMGSVVGEKIKNLSDLSINKNIPLLLFSSSGGARMQEGIVSLMQMAKTVSSVRRVMEKNIPYISIITHPTTGGVSASFSTIADIIITEPGVLFCFAGPRVVEQTIKEDMPEDFGLAGRNLKNGQVDMIINRGEMKKTLARLLRLFKG